MKRNCCSQCLHEIDDQDFYVESAKGKICSDCMVQAGPVEEDSAHLFKLRGPKGQVVQSGRQRGRVIELPLKEAL